MKKKLVVLLIVMISAYINAQDYDKIDSLKKILLTLPQINGTDIDTTRMKACIEVGDLYEVNQPDSALWWYESIADTLFSEEKIKLFPARERLNSKVLRFMGIIYFNFNDLNNAEYYYNLSLKIVETLGDKPGISACLNNLGIVYNLLGNKNEAMVCYERSAKIFEELGDQNNLAKCFNSIGDLFYDQGNMNESITYFERALKIYELSNNKRGIVSAQINLGIVLSDMGDNNLALIKYRLSLKLAEELEDSSVIAKCLINIGNIYLDQGNYNDALFYYKSSQKIFVETGEKRGIAFCLINLGIVFFRQGNFSEAIKSYEQSLIITEETGNKSGISATFMNIGNVCCEQGNYEEAKSYYDRALKIKEEIGDKNGICRCLGNLGSVCFEQAMYDESIIYYERSMKIAEELGNKNGISLGMNNIGNIYSARGNYIDAMEYFKKSMKIKEELGDKGGIATSLTNLGNICYDQGNLDEALAFYESSMKIDEEIGAVAGIAADYIIVAKTYTMLNLPEKAIPLFIKSREISISLLKDNFAILSEKEKGLYLDKTKAVFNDILSFNMKYNDQFENLDGICYNNELILKILLLKSTQSIMDAVSNSNDSLLMEVCFNYNQLKNQISELQTVPPEERDKSVEDLEKLVNEEERKLVKMSSEFADIQSLFNFKWEDVKKSLKTGEAAIEFVSFAQGKKNDTIVYAALLIKPESSKPTIIKLFEENQMQIIIDLYNGNDYQRVSKLYGTNQNINNELYKLIWQPIEQHLAGINTVYYASVGVLNKFSFAALGDGTQMLCEKYNLQQVSSTGKLIIQYPFSLEGNLTAALFGGIDYNPDTVIIAKWQYLPGTLNEKESIEKQFKKNKIKVTSFSGKEAKEERVKDLFAENGLNPVILHISTHGFFYPNPEKVRKDNGKENKSDTIIFRGSEGFGNWMFVKNKNPMMRSGLVFAGANKVWSEDWERTDNEGVLTAYEVSNMNMRNTDLVVLSACETGLGDIKGSEGVYGLQRAFKMAGVKYIIMSLWQVPDKETVEFMEMFYKKLLKIKDVRTAFNETQKEMRKKYDPYYWAAFVLVE